MITVLHPWHGVSPGEGAPRQVRAVIEIKDAKTDLDKKQNREGNQTPVEQAFVTHF